MTKPGDFVIAGGVFILVFFTGTWIMSGINAENNDWINHGNLSVYNTTFNKFNEFNTQVAILDDASASASGTSDGNLIGDTIDFINGLVNTGWSAVSSLGSNFKFIYDLFRGLTSFFLIPAWFINIIISLLVAVLAFGLLALIFGRETMGK